MQTGNNKDADETAQNHWLICFLVFAFGFNSFSHDMVHINVMNNQTHSREQWHTC